MKRGTSPRRMPKSGGCSSWPECNCAGTCEVRRFLGAERPLLRWPERLFLTAITIGGAVALWFGWETP